MSKTIRYILGIFLPPVGVFLTAGISTPLFVNIFLTLLGWLPGSIHAIWFITKQAEKQETEGTV